MNDRERERVEYRSLKKDKGSMLPESFTVVGVNTQLRILNTHVKRISEEFLQILQAQEGAGSGL